MRRKKQNERIRRKIRWENNDHVQEDGIQSDEISKSKHECVLECCQKSVDRSR